MAADLARSVSVETSAPPRRAHMVDYAPKPGRRRPINWLRVYDNACIAFFTCYLVAWFTHGFFV